MPTNLHWHTPEYAPGPMMPPDLNPTANNRDTLQKLKPAHIAATTALVFDLAGAKPAARKAKMTPNATCGEKSGLDVSS